jgi:hypothetical protein
MKNVIRKSAQLGCAALSYLTKFGSFSFIFGSKMAFFSISHCFGPLIGFFGSTLSTTIIFGIKVALGGTFSSLYHIPTFCGALYLSNKSYVVRIGIPLACMAIFVTHPIGSQAYIYSFYWFIPMLCAFSTRSIFAQTIGSTFTTHAVGSVIWLYTHALSATDWQLLTGIVWSERLLMATAMTAAYHAVSYSYKMLGRTLTQRKTVHAAPTAE